MPAWLNWYLLIINVITALTAMWDKLQAKRNGWRVPEKTLFGLAFIGGAVGLLVGMYTVRHKTRKPAFKFGVPCILILQAALLIFLIEKGLLSV